MNLTRTKEILEQLISIHNEKTILDEEIKDIKEVVEKEWSEWDQTYKCTECGDIMTEHVVNKNGELIYTPNKSGVLVDINGNEQDKVTAGVSYK